MGCMWHCRDVGINKPKDLTDCRQFFLGPEHPRHRQYEALRAYFVESRPSKDVARSFGYTEGSFRVLCHHFRRDADPEFFVTPQLGPRSQPKKNASRDLIVALRKQNHSVYEISEVLKERDIRLSPTAVREVLRDEGFAALPRRLDDERPAGPRPTVEPVADVREVSWHPRKFQTRCGGLFLFVPALVSLELERLAATARLPGSKMIPREHALRACLALKLWSIERKSHIMALVADEGLALFAGLNVIPKKSYLSEYSSRVSPEQITKLLAAWQRQVAGEKLFSGESIDLDFHSVPYYGEHPAIERHYVSMRSRRQPSVLVFMAQDADSRAFCYSNANIRKGEEPEEIFRFISFWKRHHGELPRQLVFDSRLTTYGGLARLDKMGIKFITLRRRSPKILKEVENLPASAWRRITLDVPTRTYRTPRVYEQKVQLEGCVFRQVYIVDLGHEKPTVLLTNDSHLTTPRLITRYAQRMLIENALSDGVRFFHMDALSSAVGLKIDLDMALLVVASGLYRLLARSMRGYADSQARQIFRDLIDMPADVTVDDSRITVHYHRRAHLPILLASGLMNKSVEVPWWGNRQLILTT